MLITDLDVRESRLKALYATGLLDSPPDRKFDRLTRVLAAALRVPVAAVSLVDAERQFFVSAVGLPQALAERRETPLSHSFCRHVVESKACLVIDNARQSALVAGNPAIETLGVAAYIGAPIADRNGVIIGSLCAIDHVPHVWSETDLDILTDVVTLVQNEMAERDAMNALTEEACRWQAILNAMPHLVWSCDGQGRVDGYNSCWITFTGMRSDEPALSDVWGFCHPEDRPAAHAGWCSALAAEQPFSHEFRLRHADGSYRAVTAHSVPLRNEHGVVERWLGSCTDIQAIKDLAEAKHALTQQMIGTAIERLSDLALYAKRHEFNEVRGVIKVLRAAA